MTFKELLNSVTFEETAIEILRWRPDLEPYLLWYKLHFDKLRQMTPIYHNDANSNVCYVTKKRWGWSKAGYMLNTESMEDDPWEHSLTKEIILAPDVKATNAEIAASCLISTKYYGFMKWPKIEDYGLDRNDMDLRYKFHKLQANKSFSIIRSNGGRIPSIRELSPSKKRENISQVNKSDWRVYKPMNKIKRKRWFRKEYMAEYYASVMGIACFIIMGIPVLGDQRNKISIDQLCGLFHSDVFAIPEEITSYADEKTNGAKYLCEQLRKYDIYRIDRIIMIMTTGEWHQVLTEDEQTLCKLLVGDCKSYNLLLATDPSLGKQVRINYAIFNSKDPLIEKDMKRKKTYDGSDDYINSYPISEVWGTYHYLAREIAPRLKAFKALDKHGWPEDFENQEDWNNAIQKMIDAFVLVKDYSPSYEEDIRTVEQGVELFCKYYCDLSD